MLPSREIVFSSLSRGIAPAPAIDPVEWAEKNLIVPDGPYQGQKWRRENAPYWVEPLRLLASSAPETMIAIRKSSQVGFTQLALAWLGYVVDVEPGDTMVVFPDIKSVHDFNRIKFQRSISGTPRLKRKILPIQSRSADGSTQYTKVFPGGSILMAWSSSTSDLRSKTVKNAFCDEIDEWSRDLDGQGDPMAMVDARQKAYHDTGDYKKLVGSTPTLKKTSRIDKLFEAGDRRFWNVPCPHCDGEQRLIFANLKFASTFPYNAHYECAHCGTLIEDYHRKAMIRAGRWIAEAPGPGKYPSFHIDAVSSVLTTWDKIGEEWHAAQNDQTKLKAFFNLTLGEAWDVRGDAPEWERLCALRETYDRGTIPYGGLFLTGAADVGQKGIHYEIVAWGAGETSWSIEIGYLPADNTADENDPVWKALDEVRGRTFPDSYGNRWPLNLFGIDTNYNTPAVTAWLRRWPRHNTFALRGEAGWSRPPLVAGQAVEVNWQGKRLRRGLHPWLVGTYGLKSKLYAALRKKGIHEGEATDPPGYCHFSEWHDASYFQQLVAEEVVEKKNKRGYSEMIWEKKSANHYHDCRIYNMALASYHGVDRATPEDWIKLATLRNVPPARMQEDLFERMGAIPAAAEQKATPAPAPAEKPPARRATIREHSNLRY